MSNFVDLHFMNPAIKVNRDIMLPRHTTVSLIVISIPWSVWRFVSGHDSAVYHCTEHLHIAKYL